LKQRYVVNQKNTIKLGGLHYIDVNTISAGTCESLLIT